MPLELTPTTIKSGLFFNCSFNLSALKKLILLKKDYNSNLGENYFLIPLIILSSNGDPIIFTSCPLSKHGKENADPIAPAPIINILDIIQLLKKNFLINKKTASNSILAIIIKNISEIFEIVNKLIKSILSKPNIFDAIVLVKVNKDNLKELSKSKVSINKILLKIKDLKKSINTKKAISSIIFIYFIF